MMSFNSFERYQWVLTPDGKEYILVDTQTNQLVFGANRNAQLTTATDTTQVSPIDKLNELNAFMEDYDNLSTEKSKRRK